MAADYSKGKPMGNNGVPQWDSPPAVRAVARYATNSAAASSVITLTPDTTAIEVAAGAPGGVLIKWISTTDTTASVTAANFDHAIPASTVRRFIVPVERAPQFGGALQTSQVGANQANGLFQRVAVINTGAGSVLATEYANYV